MDTNPLIQQLLQRALRGPETQGNDLWAKQALQFPQPKPKATQPPPPSMTGSSSGMVNSSMPPPLPPGANPPLGPPGVMGIPTMPSQNGIVPQDAIDAAPHGHPMPTIPPPDIPPHLPPRMRRYETSQAMMDEASQGQNPLLTRLLMNR
jgi:hypothetical protein